MQNAIGIDIGGTHTRAARVAADGRIFAHAAGPTSRNADEVFADLEAKVAGLRDAATVAIGVGVPGRVDGRSGRVLSGGYIDLSSLRLSEQLQLSTSLQAFADNDANMALVAEAQLGAARGFGDAVMLTIGTGIGGAVLTGGRIFHGGGTAGQLGHITVDAGAGGKPCNCGRSGCLETESSGTALAGHIAAAGFPAGTRIEELMRSKTEASRAVVAAWAAPLRAGIDSLVAVFGPHVVVLGGGLGGAAVNALSRFPAASPWFQCPVTAAQLGDEAGVIGAALAALERCR